MSDKNLVQGIVEELGRAKELHARYKSIGPAGTFGACVIMEAIAKAKRALASDDPVPMIEAYQELKELE